MPETIYSSKFEPSTVKSIGYSIKHFEHGKCVGSFAAKSFEISAETTIFRAVDEAGKEQELYTFLTGTVQIVPLKEKDHVVESVRLSSVDQAIISAQIAAKKQLGMSS